MIVWVTVFVLNVTIVLVIVLGGSVSVVGGMVNVTVSGGKVNVIVLSCARVVTARSSEKERACKNSIVLRVLAWYVNET